MKRFSSDFVNMIDHYNYVKDANNDGTYIYMTRKVKTNDLEFNIGVALPETTDNKLYKIISLRRQNKNCTETYHGPSYLLTDVESNPICLVSQIDSNDKTDVITEPECAEEILDDVENYWRDNNVRHQNR